MSELTLTIMRLGLLVLLWVFVFSVAGVLRGDLYGTRVTSRTGSDRGKDRARGERKEGRIGRRQPAPPAQQPAAGASAQGAPAPHTPQNPMGAVPGASAPESGRGRRSSAPTSLIVTQGPLSGTRLPLKDSGTLIGRAPESALVLEDDFASGRHARIFRDGHDWFVEDLGSTNGTFLGQHRLTSPQRVEAGSVLRIGKTVLELRK